MDNTGIEKVSAEQVLGVFQDAVEMIPKLAHARDHYKALYEAEVVKTASYERRGTIDKLASDMQQKGLDSGKSHEDLVANLETWAQQGKLAEVQRAVELAGPDMGQKIAQVYDGGADGDTDLSRYLGNSAAGGGSSVSGNAFVDFLLR